MGNGARSASGRQGVTDTAEAQAAGFGVQQGHAEQQERGTGCRQHHVLDAGFQGALVEEGIGHQAVNRYREQFQTDKQTGQVLRADQHNTAGRCQQHQQVQLFAVARIARAAFTQVGVRQGDAGQGRDQDQADIQISEVVHHQQRGDSQWSNFQRREDRQQGQVKTRHRKQEGL
ncbi:hypothetical protein PS685_04986 [Pseudomonas fluorescens]|uniref:Uncharacterized protein n=1 Tax=Pseudomonas fluorescens TaxID=294 RepID=A0A5E7A309_PSEFL|nr:hypothetical protein PS685_04986 [Pseudomonas fluorescens]